MSQQMWAPSVSAYVHVHIYTCIYYVFPCCFQCTVYNSSMALFISPPQLLAHMHAVLQLCIYVYILPAHGLPVHTSNTAYIRTCTLYMYMCVYNRYTGMLDAVRKVCLLTYMYMYIEEYIHVLRSTGSRSLLPDAITCSTHTHTCNIHTLTRSHTHTCTHTQYHYSRTRLCSVDRKYQLQVHHSTDAESALSEVNTCTVFLAISIQCL